MFINFTSHPAEKWDAKQILAAQQYGNIVDMSFPLINPIATSADIFDLANGYVQRIIAMSPKAVLCQGEFTLAFAIVSELKKHGVLVRAACSERCVTEHME